MDVTVVLLVVLAALGLGGGSGYILRTVWIQKGVTSARQSASGILQEAEEQQKRLVLEAKEEALRLRSTAEEDLRSHRSELQGRQSELQSRESRVTNREEQLDKRADTLEDREGKLGGREQELGTREQELEELKGQEEKRLEAVADLTMTEAKEQLIERAENEVRHELARRYRDAEQRMKEESDEQARKVITLAIHRFAADVVSENTTAIVSLPSDDMKGRIIGREGRNIRAIEAATGVDVIIDDTPEAVTVSCFDPIRREVAKVALAALVQDGRIHPARIEEVVKRSEEEVQQTIWKEGERAVFEAGVLGLNPELIRLIGRLKYRYSYGENILRHSIEVASFAGLMAGEIGANVEVAKAGGLLHDIGKALTHEVQGPHAEIGGDVARKYGISHEIERAIMEHHDEEKGSVEAFLVAAADAISSARPGARRDTVENYVKRLEALEEVANSFSGVEKSFAIQAGREVRIMVSPESIDDIGSAVLAQDIVKKIEETLAYPGQIKVTVIRETRSVEYAR